MGIGGYIATQTPRQTQDSLTPKTVVSGCAEVSQTPSTLDARHFLREVVIRLKAAYRRGGQNKCYSNGVVFKL